ncbi:MAG: hypothetical protein V4686_01855 [Patescibacteria group bacterium]
MNIPTPSGRIKIVRIPRGEAPEDMRIAWVGIRLPCQPFLDVVQGGGVLTGKKEVSKWCFVTPQILAIQALSEKNPAAAAWWYQHCEHDMEDNFCFEEDEAEIQDESVRRAVYQELTEEMDGHLDR